MRWELKQKYQERQIGEITRLNAEHEHHDTIDTLLYITWQEMIIITVLL